MKFKNQISSKIMYPNMCTMDIDKNYDKLLIQTNSYFSKYSDVRPAIARFLIYCRCD